MIVAFIITRVIIYIKAVRAKKSAAAVMAS
jgi:hypothetical protein